MVKVGYAQGKCPMCGRLLLCKRPADYALCDCYRYCQLCTPPYTVLMTPFKPDLTLSTYRNEKAQDVKSGSAEPPEWTTETVFVCQNHSPPHYSKQKPVEVRLQ